MQALKLELNDLDPVLFEHSMNSIKDRVRYKVISLDDVIENDSECIYIVIPFVTCVEILNRAVEYGKRILSVRLLHKSIEEFQLDSNSLFIFDKGIKATSKKAIQEMLQIKRKLPIPTKLTFTDLPMTEDSIQLFCRANLKSQILSMFFNSITEYRKLLEELPQNTKVLYYNEEINYITVKILNCLVRGNRDYLCRITLVNNERIEDNTRVSIFSFMGDHIDFLCDIILNDYSTGVS